MFETRMTVVGNLVDEPTLRRLKTGDAVASFRIASTPRRYDRETGAWADTPTLYVNVKAWRALGENVAKSLHRGQSVIVSGRYRQREYEKNETLHTVYELEADVVGHDLTRGISSFEKVTRRLVPTIERDENGIPADESAHYLDYADEDEPVDDTAAADGSPITGGTGQRVDLVTGEVRDLEPVA